MVYLEAAKLTIRRAHLWKIASNNDFRGDTQNHIRCQMVEVSSFHTCKMKYAALINTDEITIDVDLGD